MERSYEKRHSKHHKEKHKKRAHKKHRSHSSSGTHATIACTKPLVEYSDVSSEDLSAPEAGEIESESSSIGRHIADDLDRTRTSRPIRTFVDDKTISVINTSKRRIVDEYALTRDSSSAALRKKRDIVALEYAEPEPDLEHSRHKKKREKRKKEKKKRKRKLKHRSRSASLESLSPEDDIAVETPGRSATPQRYETVPLTEWDKPSSPLRNGSCSPISPSTPPLKRDRREPSPHMRKLSREPLHHDVIPYSPPHERSPPLR